MPCSKQHTASDGLQDMSSNLSSPSAPHPSEVAPPVPSLNHLSSPSAPHHTEVASPSPIFDHLTSNEAALPVPSFNHLSSPSAPHHTEAASPSPSFDHLASPSAPRPNDAALPAASFNNLSLPFAPHHLSSPLQSEWSRDLASPSWLQTHAQRIAPTAPWSGALASNTINFALGISATAAYRVLSAAIGKLRTISKALQKRARPLRTRRRVKLAVTPLVGEFAGMLSRDAKLWFQRLNGFYEEQHCPPLRLVDLPPLVSTLPLPDLPSVLPDGLLCAAAKSSPDADDLFGAMLSPSAPRMESKHDELASWFSTFLQSGNIHNFNDHLRAAFAEDPSTSLTPQAVRRGFGQLLYGTRVVSGGRHLSRLTSATLFWAQRTVAALLDCERSWNQDCAVALNQTEISNVLFHITNSSGGSASPSSALAHTFDVLVAEMNFFASVRDAHVLIDLRLAKRLAALCQFALFLSRPASRQQLVSLIPWKATKVQLEDTDACKVYLTFAKHKGASTYGAVFWPVSAWVTPLLQFYSARVRSVLLADSNLWGPDEAAADCFFPPASVSTVLLADFGKSAGLQDLTLAQIRTMFCEYVQSVAATPDHPWATRAEVIQATAAHGVSSVVIRNYDVTTKLSQGDLLAEFVADQCILPALLRAKELINDTVASPALIGSTSSSSSTASCSSSSYTSPDPQGSVPLLPVQASPRKRSLHHAHLLPATPPATPPAAASPVCSEDALSRVCRNRQKGKKCMSGRNEPPVFEDHTSLNCVACLAAFGGSGIFNATRAKKLRTG
jgi:hypothetical protein